MNLKGYFIISLLVINVFCLFQVPTVTSIPLTNETTESLDVLDGYNVLIFVSNFVGNSYFVFKNEMEALGATVTTIGLRSTHQSCGNVEAPVTIETDLTISNFDSQSFKDYEALILPSGGYWSSMLLQDDLMEFIESAYENDLFIVSICIGMVILSETSIIDGVTMVSHSTATTYLTDAGAEMDYLARVVFDNGIISGGTGGGLTHGRYLAAPHKELCLMLARRILGYSYISKAELVKQESNYSILVEVNDIEEVSTAASNISSVIAEIYESENSLVDTITLQTNGSLYKGVVVGLKSGKYRVRISVRTTDDILEISRDVLSISIGLSISGFEIISTLLALTLLITGTIIVRRKH